MTDGHENDVAAIVLYQSRLLSKLIVFVNDFFWGACLIYRYVCFRFFDDITKDDLGKWFSGADPVATVRCR